MDKQTPVSRSTHQTSSPSDRLLLHRFQRGDDDAATKLHRKYAKRLQLLVKSQAGNDLSVRVDADDIVQSIFRTFFRRVSAGHYDVPDGEELWKLFLVIGLNKVRSVGKFHRAAKRDITRTEELERVAALLVDWNCPSANAYQVLSFTVENLLEPLPATQQEMVAMRIEGRQIRHIATATRRSRRSVERVLQAFRERLQTQIAED